MNVAVGAALVDAEALLVSRLRTTTVADVLAAFVEEANSEVAAYQEEIGTRFFAMKEARSEGAKRIALRMRTCPSSPRAQRL